MKESTRFPFIKKTDQDFNINHTDIDLLMIYEHNLMIQLPSSSFTAHQKGKIIDELKRVNTYLSHFR